MSLKEVHILHYTEQSKLSYSWIEQLTRLGNIYYRIEVRILHYTEQSMLKWTEHLTRLGETYYGIFGILTNCILKVRSNIVDVIPQHLSTLHALVFQ